MKLISDNFKHLDVISIEFTSFGKNFSPSLSWSGYDPRTSAFLIVMTNSKTKKIHWVTMIEPNKSNLGLNESGFDWVKYYGPNDVNDVVTYVITIYALKNPEKPFEESILPKNIYDKAYIKFIFNGY